MKKIRYYTIGTLLVLLASCSTMEDRDSLSSKASPDQINLTAVSTTTPNGKNGNQIVVSNLTPQFGGQWDLLVKRSNRTSDTAVLPFVGNVVIYYLATTGGGLVRDSVVVRVDTIDHPVDTTYTLLAGTGVTGKTWVWGTGNPYSGAAQNVWGNGSGNTDPPSPNWWGVPSGASFASQTMDSVGKMIFDLNGAANFTKIENGLTTQGSFSFDFTKHSSPLGIGQLTITGTTIMHGISQNDDQAVVHTFDICRLTENDMVLLYLTQRAPNNTWPEAWFWIFKREGYTYPAL